MALTAGVSTLHLLQQHGSSPSCCSQCQTVGGAEAAKPLDLSALTAISAVDGRYESKTKSLRAHFSEYALHRCRVEVMVKWVLHMSDNKEMKEVKELSQSAREAMLAIITDFDVAAAASVKKIERTTNHDLKAVEYHIKQQMDKHPELVGLKETEHITPITTPPPPNVTPPNTDPKVISLHPAQRIIWLILCALTEKCLVK